jgi:hypothetical protein
MIITDPKEIYKNVEIGDILCVYTDSYKRDKIIRKVTGLTKCTSGTGCGWGCKNLIDLEDYYQNCFQYGSEKCILVYLIKKENFISEEEFMV